MQAASGSADMLERFSNLQISQRTSHTKHCTFAVLPLDSTEEEFTRTEYRHRTPVLDGANLLHTVLALLPSDQQLESVWLCPCFKDGLAVIFQRVDPHPTFSLQRCHMIANFASVADEYMEECLAGVPVDFEAEFRCTVQYVPRNL